MVSSSEAKIGIVHAQYIFACRTAVVCEYEWVLNYRVRTVPEHIATSLFTAGEAGGQSSRPILPQTIPTLLGSPQI